MNDFLKSLLKGIPQQEDYQPIEKNDPSLDPRVYPSPLMSPMQALEKEVADRKVNLGTMPEERIIASPKPAVMKPGLPPTGNAEAMDKIELPQEMPAKKAPSLEDILAGVKPDNDLANAQSDNQDFIRNVLLARAGNKIGSSIAGVKADDNFGQDLIDYSGKKVSDLKDLKKSNMDARNQAISEAKSGLDYKRVAFELGDKEKENDPNSDVSKAFREYAKSYVKMAGAGIAIDDRLSMADLQKQMGTIGNIVSAKMAQDARKDALSLAASTKAEAKDSKKEIENLNWADKTATALNKNPFYVNYNKIKSNSAQFENAIKNPSGVADISALYSFVKFLDTESAVREGEIDLALSAVGGIEKIKLNMQKALATGDVKVIPTSMIKKMAEANEILKRKTAQSVGSELSRIELQANKRGADILTAVPDYDMLRKEIGAASKTEQSPAQDDPRIDAFMKKNNITDRNEAIKILKENKRL